MPQTPSHFPSVVDVSGVAAASFASHENSNCQARGNGGAISVRSSIDVALSVMGASGSTDGPRL